MQDMTPVATRSNPASTARIAHHPIHPMLVPFPVVCFVGTLLTDLAYWKTAEMMWADFSAWLLFVGLIMGVLAAIAGLIDLTSALERLKQTSFRASPKLFAQILAEFKSASK